MLWVRMFSHFGICYDSSAVKTGDPNASCAGFTLSPLPPHSKYQPPTDVRQITQDELLSHSSAWQGSRQTKLDFGEQVRRRNRIYYAGDLSLLGRPCISVVGTRKVSREGAARARRLAKELANAGVVVMSGLASGVDTEALASALEAGGRTIAVIGTPIDKASPIANAMMQETIYRDHLLLSQFEPGSKVWPSNFPLRNRLMAALSSGTVIIEASDTSGTLHQAAECTKLGRWLFIAQSMAARSTALVPMISPHTTPARKCLT